MEEQWTWAEPSASPQAPAEVLTEWEPAPPPVDLRQAKRAFGRVELFAFLLLLIFQAAAVVIIVVVGLVRPALTASIWFSELVSLVPLYLFALPISMLLLRRLPRRAPMTNFLTAGRLVSLFLICLFLTYASNLLCSMSLAVLQAVTGLQSVNPVSAMLDGSGFWDTLLFMVILAPIGEEWVFRRLVLDRIRCYGEKTAVLVSALLFALFHGNLSQGLYAFLLGCVFAYVYLRTGRLRYCIGLHMAINAVGSLIPVVVLLPGLERLEALSMEEIGSMTTEALLPYLGTIVGVGLYALLLVGGFIAGLVLFLQRWRKICFLPAEQELPREARFRTAFRNPGLVLLILLFLALTAITFLD